MFAEHTHDCMSGIWFVQDGDFGLTPTLGTGLHLMSLSTMIEFNLMR